MTIGVETGPLTGTTVCVDASYEGPQVTRRMYFSAMASDEELRVVTVDGGVFVDFPTSFSLDRATS